MRLFSGYSDGTTAQSAWEPVHFPGGEVHVGLINETPLHQIAVVENGTSDELMLLAMFADAARRNNQFTTAVIPYLPGARQDRGAPLGAKVYADFINSMQLGQVICFDPHSDVMLALLDRLTVVALHELPIWEQFGAIQKWVGVIAPDVGARKRAEAVASVLGVSVYQATKHRDFRTGKLSGFGCEPLPKDGTLLVVDDICDGGGTFLGLADAIELPRERLALWVSHGIFSNGAFPKLNEKYGEVITTDSWRRNANPYERVLPSAEVLSPDLGIIAIIPSLVAKAFTL